MLLVAVGLIALWIVVTGRLTQLQTAWTYLQGGSAGVASLSSAPANSTGGVTSVVNSIVGGNAGTIGTAIGGVVAGITAPLSVPTYNI